MHIYVCGLIVLKMIELMIIIFCCLMIVVGVYLVFHDSSCLMFVLVMSLIWVSGIDLYIVAFWIKILYLFLGSFFLEKLKHIDVSNSVT